MLWVLGLSLMAFVFLWQGYSEVELVSADIDRRRSPPPPWRDRIASWVRTAERQWPGYGPQVRQELAQVGLGPARYLMQMGLVGGLAGIALGWDLNWWVAPMGFVVGSAGVRWALHFRYREWLTQVTAQMGDVVILLKARLQAGETVRQAVRRILPQLSAPARTEWARLVGQLDAGLSLQEALAGFMEQVPDRDVAAVMQQLAVYDRESVPPDPFGNLAAHLSRMKLLKRDYLVKRSTNTITMYTGLAFFMAMIGVLAPALYSLWVTALAGAPL